MNTQNTKFTFNKKSFALSLACVGFLATAGNAAITGTDVVTGVTNPTDSQSGFYFSGALTTGSNIVVDSEVNGASGTSTNNILGFIGSGSATGTTLGSGGFTVNAATANPGILHTFNFYGGSVNATGAYSAAGAYVTNLTFGTASAAGGGVAFGVFNVEVGTANLGTNATNGVSGSGQLNLINSKLTFNENVGTINVNNASVKFSNEIATNEITQAINVNSVKFDVSGADVSKLIFNNEGTINTLNFGTNLTRDSFVGSISGATGIVGAVNIANAGTITNLNVTKTGGVSTKVAQFQVENRNNSVITNFTNNGEFTISAGATLTPSLSASPFAFANTGTVGTFTNNGLLNYAYIKNDGIVDTFTNNDRITNSIITSSGGITNFTNNGRIIGSNINVAGKIKAFTNTGTIGGFAESGAMSTSGGTFTLSDVDVFNNSGVITTSGASTAVIWKSFENSGVIDASGAGSITVTLKGSNQANYDATTAKNTGSLTDVDFFIEGARQVTSFTNESGATILRGSLSGGETSGHTSVLNTFTNAGSISQFGLAGVTINNLINSYDLEVIATGDRSVHFGNIENTGRATLNASADNVVTTLDQKFVNEKDARFTFNASGAQITLEVTGSTEVTARGEILNKGTITSPNLASGGIIRIGESDTGNFIKSFENTNTGLVSNIILSGGRTDEGGIVNFKNAGVMDNVAFTSVGVTHFENTGTIGFGSGTDSITIRGNNVSSKHPAIFKNTGTIGNVAGFEAHTGYVDFDNTGTIEISGGSNFLTINGADFGAHVDFNNSGVVNFMNNQGGTAFQAAASATSSGASLRVVNTGEINLNDRTGFHFDLTQFREKSVNVDTWHLSKIGDAATFNTDGVLDTSTDRIVINGLVAYDKANPTADKRQIIFRDHSLVIDPLKNPNLQVGVAYDLDRILVNSSGASVEALGASGGTGIYDAVAKNKKEGKKDPRLVTINTLTASDDIIEVVGVDKYAQDGKLVGQGDVTQTVTTYYDASGNAVQTPVSGGTSGTTTQTVTGTIAGDGIIDAFQVNVNLEKGASAATARNSATQVLARNAFIGNTVNSAVNSALIQVSNLSRVSANDADTSSLEKYAAVSSDVADQSYAKDTSVFAVPYFRSTSVDLENGGSLDGDTFGLIIGGQKVVSEAGVFGLFLGYETGSADGGIFEQEDDTFYGGFNYYNTLGGTSTYDYFVKAMLRAASTSSDVTRTTNGVADTSGADSLSYGVEGTFGMNFYSGFNTLTPEFGLSYDRVSIDGFKVNGIDYDDTTVNLMIARLGFNWLGQFTDTFSANAGVGIKYNFDDSFDASARLFNNTFTTDVALDDLYYYLNAGVNFAITPNWDLGLVYSGDFSSEATAHSGFVRISYWW